MTFRRLVVGATTAIAVLTACSPARPPSRERPIEVTVDDRPRGTSRLKIGLTHTQRTFNSEAQEAARARGLISGKQLFQNQHIMGWGALSPEPSPGVYDWASLDSRMDLIRGTSGIPVITLCCAPDWMKGGAPGETEWSELNKAPAPGHYADFARLSGQVAKRYPDVKHFQVWHGLKGFYDKNRRRWNYEGYTQLYNLVYRELKSVNPEIQVGGPYVIMDSWSKADKMSNPSRLKGPWGVVDQRALSAISFWLRKKEGADFVSLDLSTPNKDDRGRTDPFQSTQKLAAVAKWVQQRTDLPLWASRWNVFPDQAKNWGLERQKALLATGLVHLAHSGVDVALLWEPQGRNDLCLGCLWTDATIPGGGQPTPAFATLDSLAASFAPGTPFVRTLISSRAVTGASTPTRTVLINNEVKPKTVKLNGSSSRLDPYEIRIYPMATTAPKRTKD